MHDSAYLESSQSFIDKVLSLDNEMKEKFTDGKDKNVSEIYQLYFDRLSFYEK